MVVVSKKATGFQLKGPGIDVAFDAIRPALKCNGKIFLREALECEKTTLGLIVIISHAEIPGVHTEKLAVLIPHVSCTQPGESVKVNTFAAPIASDGQVEKWIPLDGTAQVSAEVFRLSFGDEIWIGVGEDWVELYGAPVKLRLVEVDPDERPWPGGPTMPGYVTLHFEVAVDGRSENVHLTLNRGSSEKFKDFGSGKYIIRAKQLEPFPKADPKASKLHYTAAVVVTRK